jgi:hypothetical protein
VLPPRHFGSVAQRFIRVTVTPPLFKTELALVVNPLQVRLADIFYPALQGATQHTLHCQHASTGEMLDQCLALCTETTGLSTWPFKDEQLELVALLLQTV